MSKSVAKKAITDAFDTIGPSEELEIDFFGGEPFLCFDLIKDIFDWVVNVLKPSSPYIFFATTNGTKIHNGIQEWLTKNRSKFYCCLSIDGTKRMHDVNRSSSFDKIDLDFFVKNWPDQPVKMTLSPQTLPSLFEGVIFLQEQGFEVECNLAEGIDWSDHSLFRQLYSQLSQLGVCRTQ